MYDYEAKTVIERINQEMMMYKKIVMLTNRIIYV